MASRKLIVEIVGDTRDLEKSFRKASGETDSFGKSMAKNLGKAGVAGAIIGLGAAAKIGFDEFMEGQRVAAQTAAVLKSTGGAANVTAREIDNLAESLLRKSGVDDEEIKTGQNMLLTFTKIRNEVGRGNDIFNQATKATLDLSVAMGKDMQSSALLVGKALNDPIKGMTALSRAGIQFTAEQKETVKAMVEHGETAKAQKIILKELETQFGGSAAAAGKTFSGQINIAKESLKNMAAEGIVKAMPHLQSFATWIQKEALPRLRELWGFVQQNVIPIFKQLGAIFVQAWQSIAKVLKDNDKEIDGILNGLKTLIGAIVTVMKFWAENVIIPILKPLFTTVLPTALNFTIEALGFLFAAADKVRDVLVWLRDKGGAAIATLKNAAAKPLEDVKEAFDGVASVIGKIVDGIKWLIDNIPKVPKIPGWLDPRNIGDVAAGFNAGAAGAMRPRYGAGGLQPSTANLLGQIQSMFGNVLVTSGFRTPEQNAAVNGAPNSDHLTGRAFDLVPASGWNAATIALFDKIAAFAAGLDSVRWIGWRGVPGHGPGDHLHISTFERGGTVPGVGPQLAIVHGGETITPRGLSGPVTLQVMLDRRVLAEAMFDPLRNVNQRFAQASGRSGF